MSSHDTQQVKIALAQTHIAILLLAGTALFSRVIEYNATVISLGRAFIAFWVLACLVKLTEKRIRLHSWRDYRNGTILGALMAAHWVTYFYAMQFSSVATGMIALYTFPVITVLIEPLMQKKLPKFSDIFLAVVVVIGVALMVPEFSLKSEHTVGILLGVLSAIFFAFRNIMNKQVFAHYSGAKNMMFQALIVTLCLLPFEWQAFTAIPSSPWVWYFLLLGTAFTALPHVLVVSGLKYLQAKSMALISCLSPFYGAILAALLLAEYPDIWTIVGGTLVVSAAVFETLAVKKASK
ncbi:EamA family transporter [Catenovulum sp. SM1970]|uniref:DMT family transporter n=1 Tax=Marinifaba aquimaris TaxID=2741323 RepID=UPI0015748BCF|nr:DMT family transporter [Marinifaba aquimaris]NTS76875.1 EamA family transporter [Marinifaba aquimaris]